MTDSSQTVPYRLHYTTCPPGLHVWESYVRVSDPGASTLNYGIHRLSGQMCRRCKICGHDEGTSQWVNVMTGKGIE